MLLSVLSRSIHCGRFTYTYSLLSTLAFFTNTTNKELPLCVTYLYTHTRIHKHKHIHTHPHTHRPEVCRGVQKRQLIAPQTDMSMKYTRCCRCFGAISSLAPLLADSRTKSLSYYYLEASSHSCFHLSLHLHKHRCMCLCKHTVLSIKSLMHPVCISDRANLQYCGEFEPC